MHSKNNFHNYISIIMIPKIIHAVDINIVNQIDDETAELPTKSIGSIMNFLLYEQYVL